MEKKATRDGYGEGLVELGENNPEVVVLCADLSGSTKASMFMKKFPDRYFSMGVAEADMISTAAGFALAGKIPFVSSFSVFVMGRTWDQVRVNASYSGLDIKIGGSHSGISVGPDGPTHQALEDIAISRVLPNMKVIVPCDAIETRKATIASAGIQGPVYTRFGRAAVPVITEDDTPFTVGKANLLREGSDLTIIACGLMVYEALTACDILKKKGISARVINMHTIKPLDIAAVVNAAEETGAIVTVEEHQLFGGLGSAVSEVIVQNCPVPVEMVGMKDCFGESGEAEELLEKYHLKDRDIVEAARKVLKRKK